MSECKNDGQPSMPTNPPRLAVRLVKELFELGDEPGLPCQRIAFMCAEKEGRPESEQGGVSRGALLQMFEGIICDALENA